MTRKPDKNRYLNAINHIESEEIAFGEEDIELTVAKKILGRDLPMVWLATRLPARDYVELVTASGSDMVFLNDVWELGRKNIFDSEGRQHYVDGKIKTRELLKDIEYPNLDLVKRRIEGMLEAIEGTGLGLKYAVNPAPFIVATAMGYQDYYTNLIVDPCFVREFVKMVHGYCMRQLEVALSYPVDVIQICISVCSKSGPMVSREIIEEFDFPPAREQIGLVKSKGIPVSLHSDGNVVSLIEDFIDMGVDVLNPLEPCGGEQDIYQIKEAYGNRIALQGNIDLSGVLVYGTPEEVQEDVVRHIERLAAGGGYICASSHNITEAVPLENFYAMRDAVHAYRFKAQ